jgi:hypothetical protein
MADEGGRMTPEALVIFKTLDFCKTPLAPVGYPIVGMLNQSIRTSPTVNETSQPAFTSFSRVATVIGNEAGVGGGVMSMVNKGMCKPITWSQTVRMDGNWAIMNTVEMMMNCPGPEGQSNTFGKLVYIKCVAAATVTPGGEIATEPEEEAKSDAAADNSGGGDDNGSDDPPGSDEDPELQKEIEETEREIAEAEAEVARIENELKLELAQAAVDAAGILDPSPASDAISAGMSAAKGDWFGVAMSTVSMFPYFGDAIAKPAKAAKAAKIINKLKTLLTKAKSLLKKLKDKLAKLKRQKKRGKKGEGGKGEVRITQKPKKGKRTKNRLPDGKDGNLGPKNGTLEKRNPQTGELQQKREYDEFGKPKKDIDYGHDNTGVGDPHVHDWKYESPQAPNPTRSEPRAPMPGELL